MNKDKERIKNGKIISSLGNANHYHYLELRLTEFVGDKYKDAAPKSIPTKVMMQIEALDRTLFYLDLFLFTYYAGRPLQGKTQEKPTIIL